VESSSGKPAQGGPGRLANRDVVKKLKFYLKNGSENFPPSVGVLLEEILVEPGGPRAGKFERVQDRRGYPQYCLASENDLQTKKLSEPERFGCLKEKWRVEKEN
jgi:hypothetical protein